MENPNNTITTVQFPVQPEQSPTPTVLPPKKSGKKKIILLVSAVVAVLAIAAGLLLWYLSNTQFFGWKAPELPILGAEQITELEQKYGYDITYRPDVSPTEKFTLMADYNYGYCQVDTCADAIAVYSTADLSKKVNASVIAVGGASGHDVIVTPPATNTGFNMSVMGSSGFADTPATSGENSSLAISSEDRWGIAEMYFLVERLDEKGTRLSRPKVTVFTVKADHKMLQATDVTASVDSNGSVNFSWSAVENAKEYYLVKIERDKAKDYIPAYTVIARSSATTLNLGDYNGDKNRAEKALLAQGVLSEDSSSLGQNSQLHGRFTSSYKSEDDYYSREDGTNSLPSGKYIPVENGVMPTTFAVIAVNGDAYSAAREIDGNALLASTPVSIASNQYLTMLDQQMHTDAYSFDSLSKLYPVTMADGHTAKKAVIYDASKASVDTTGKKSDELILPFMVQGTYIATSDSVYGAKGSFTKEFIKSKVEELNKRNLAATPPTGAVDLPYLVKTDADLQLSAKSNTSGASATQTTSDKGSDAKTIPTVEYPVNGSTNLVKFIAANLMAGNYSMDIATYYTDPTIGIWDAFWEAVYQNPYVKVNSGYIKGIRLNGSILTVQYEGVTKDEMIHRQKTLLDQARTVAQSTTNSSMSDRNKALAINRWLSENATYDDDALAMIEQSEKSGDISMYYTNFPYAWNGLGTAVYKKGVCASYADAFKAISDQAGLEAVTVNGTDNISGVRHAWNKAYMDGKWQVIDVTWDDSAGGSFTDYFGLTDAASNRVQDEYFMVDRFISDYAAN
jgi:hypothetical protein